MDKARSEETSHGEMDKDEKVMLVGRVAGAVAFEAGVSPAIEAGFIRDSDERGCEGFGCAKDLSSSLSCEIRLRFGAGVGKPSSSLAEEFEILLWSDETSDSDEFDALFCNLDLAMSVEK